MRPFLALVLLALLAPLSRASDVEFVRVWPEWRDTDSFDRISEYFTGRENTGGQVIVRTQPKSRAGFYFLARVKNSGSAQPAAKLILSLIKPDAPQVHVYTFPVALPNGEAVFNQKALRPQNRPEGVLMVRTPHLFRQQIRETRNHELPGML